MNEKILAAELHEITESMWGSNKITAHTRAVMLNAAAVVSRNAEVPRWTSVKDNQPKVWKNSDGSMVNYFVYTKEFGVDIGNYLAPASTWLCFGFPSEVTHWMPLPEPPEEVTK